MIWTFLSFGEIRRPLSLGTQGGRYSWGRCLCPTLIPCLRVHQGTYGSESQHVSAERMLCAIGMKATALFRWKEWGLERRGESCWRGAMFPDPHFFSRLGCEVTPSSPPDSVP